MTNTFHAKTSKARVIVAGLVTLLSSSAYADQQDGICCRSTDYPRWYGAVSGSVAYLSKAELTHPDFSIGGADTMGYKLGYTLSAAVGYKVFSGVRMELQVIRGQNDVHKDSVGPVSTADSTETEKSMAYMFNTYVDFHNSSHYTPYIGAGIGENHIIVPRFYTDGGGNSSGKVAGYATAYQFMFGVGYETELDPLMPVTLNLGYRYFNSDLSTTMDVVPGNISVPYKSNNIELGARLYFN